MRSKLAVLLVLGYFGCLPSYASVPLPSDTLLAYQHFVKAREFQKSSAYDSALIFYQKAAIAYKNKDIWPRHINTILAINKIKLQRLAYDEAQSNLLKILPEAQAKLGKEHPEIGNIYTLLGKVYRGLGNYDQALVNYEAGLSIREKNKGPQEALAESYHQLGMVWRIKGKREKALAHHQKSLEISKATFGESHPYVAKSYCEIAVVYKNSGEYDSAMDFYQRSVDIFLQSVDSDDPSLAPCYNGMGIIYAQTGRYTEALDYFNKLLVIDKKSLGDSHPDLARTYTNLGILNELIGDYNQALDLHHKALNIKLKSLGEDHPSLKYDYKGLASIYKIRKDPDQALLFLQKALQLELKSLGDSHPELGATYNLLGGIFLDLGKPGEALKYYRESEKVLLRTNKNSPTLGPTYHDLALICQKNQEYQKAMNYAEKALHINTSFVDPDHIYLAENHMLIGNIHKDANDLEKAMAHYELARDINREAGRDLHPLTARAYQYMASVYNSQGDYEKALITIQKSLISISKDFDNLDIKSNPLPENAINASHMIDILGQKGNILYRLYQNSLNAEDLSLSFDVLQQAVSLIDEVRTSYKSESSVEIFRNEINPILETAVEVAYERYHKTGEANYMEKAFEFAEKSKAGLLMAAVQESKAQKFAGVPDTLLQAERSLKQDLNFYDRQLFEETQKNQDGDSIKIAFYQNQKFALKRRYDTLVSKLETAYSDYYRLKYNTEVVSIEKVKSDLLSASDLLVEYFISDSSIFVFAIGKQQTKFVRLKKSATFEHDIEALRDILTEKKDEPDRFATLAHGLYLSLLAPAVPEIKDFKLIISPDRALSYLPFELLVKNEVGAGSNFFALPYLINDHPVSYTYSASMWQEVLSKRSNPHANEYLALAPDFNKRENFAGSEIAMQALAEPVRGALVELEGTSREISVIDGLFKGSFYEGSRATEQQFKKLAENYGILHLATHAIVDDQHPMNSRLLFTINQDSIEDGDLYAWELYNMRLNAEMAVLSACNTGSGKLQQGEGVKSLGWAFTYAGCRSIVMSLWPAQDRSTADLMTYFYQGLSKGYSKDRALQEAKLNYLKNADEIFSHPFYWAGFVVQGNSGPVTSHTNKYYLWLVLGVLLADLIIVLFRLKQKNHQRVS
ncbi:CHAT domain-containing protein [Fulvivirgaceae bacterium BMA12]|uniref:CHAT domain-containing protein n=1 Tax=Agaribacillus aureus TaxID=3051825 RepID=A0ABT8L6D1_9BACT|nr:CHAT domain-containing protein [Fulvivirgaceae bacterium BMA12]